MRQRAREPNLSLVNQTLGGRGIVLSGDQSTLFVSTMNRYGEVEIYRLPVSPDGSVGAPVIFVPAKSAGIGAGGMCVDQAGNLYHARGVIRIFSPTGVALGMIQVGGANDCAFGEADLRTMFVTTSSSAAVHNLYRVRMNIPGV